ncbi:E3 ubiquitin-protein ligase CCNB1IP1-like [Lytechinus pictus]|uniref:E3 ubiquitin-protein ligase CCNB1IP1-like n=1 Tax=Lytechinus pictus TaxID=7653 RepID=UPI0030B9B34E
MEDMVCNYRKCRQSLNSNAWVTSCSHIFCDEHGSKEFNKKALCPACDNNLPGKFDVIRIDLSPSEQYKSMVLAGQRPEIILEVCSRALAFWTYQIEQERTYQDYVSKKAKERNTQMEQYCEQLLNRTQTEVSSLKSQISALRREVEGTKKRYNDVYEKLVEKNRQHQKLQLMYDSLRRKSITVTNMDSIEGNGATGPGGGGGDFEMPISFVESHKRSSAEEKRMKSAPAEREFVLNPTNTPLHGQSDNDSIYNRFNLELGTPNEISRRLGHRKM